MIILIGLAWGTVPTVSAFSNASKYGLHTVVLPVLVYHIFSPPGWYGAGIALALYCAHVQSRTITFMSSNVVLCSSGKWCRGSKVRTGLPNVSSIITCEHPRGVNLHDVLSCGAEAQATGDIHWSISHMRAAYMPFTSSERTVYELSLPGHADSATRLVASSDTLPSSTKSLTT